MVLLLFKMVYYQEENYAQDELWYTKINIHSQAMKKFQWEKHLITYS